MSGKRLNNLKIYIPLFLLSCISTLFFIRLIRVTPSLGSLGYIIFVYLSAILAIVFLVSSIVTLSRYLKQDKTQNQKKQNNKFNKNQSTLLHSDFLFNIFFQCLHRPLKTNFI